MDDYQEALASIEARVDRGETDLGDLGFWRLVARAKREPPLPDEAREAAASGASRTLRAALGFEQMQILLARSGERMVHRVPPPFVGVPSE